MKKSILLLAPMLLLAACSGAPTESVADGGHGAGNVTFTHYSDLTEVFAEHRPLVVGKDRRFDVLAQDSWNALAEVLILQPGHVVMCSIV